MNIPDLPMLAYGRRIGGFYKKYKCCKACLVAPRCLSVHKLTYQYLVTVTRPCKKFKRLHNRMCFDIPN